MTLLFVNSFLLIPQKGQLKNCCKPKPYPLQQSQTRGKGLRAQNIFQQRVMVIYGIY